MPLTIEQRVEDGIGILTLSGNLTLGPSLVTLRNNARQLLDSQKLSGLVLDAGGLLQTDSSGLGELTLVYTLAAKRNCRLVLVRANPTLGKMLSVTRLDGLMPPISDMDTAKAQLKNSSR